MSTTTPAGAVSVIADGTALTQVEVNNIGHYAKVLIAIAAPALMLLATAAVITPEILGQAIIGILAVIPVYFVTKKFALKAVTLGVAAAIQAVIPLIGVNWNISAVTWQDWVAVGITALGAAGVYVAPNGVKSTTALVPTNQSIASTSTVAPLAEISPADNSVPVTGTLITADQNSSTPSS